MDHLAGIIVFAIIVGAIVFVFSKAQNENEERNTPTKCPSCLKLYPKYELRNYGGMLFCPSCVNKYSNCFSCGHPFRRESLTEFMHRQYCPSCFSVHSNEELGKIRYGKTTNKITCFDDYSEHLHSHYWKTIRQIALAKANYKCTRCGAKGYLQGHHLTYRNVGNERIEDIQILCEICHVEEHSLNDSTRDWTGHPTKGVKHVIRPVDKPNPTVQHQKNIHTQTKLLSTKYSQSELSTQCRAMTTKGERCKLKVIEGGIFCRMHIMRLEKKPE